MAKRKALPDSPLAALGVTKKRQSKKPRKQPAAKGAKAAASGEKRARTIYLPQDLDRRLRIAAAETDKTISDLVADALAAYLKPR